MKSPCKNANGNIRQNLFARRKNKNASNRKRFKAFFKQTTAYSHCFATGTYISIVASGRK